MTEVRSRGDNILSEDEIIAQSKETTGDGGVGIETVLDACETFYMNGCADETSGDVEAPTGHFYRVHRWIVYTDSQGFKSLETHDSEEDAKRAFNLAEEEYDEWVCDTDD